MSVLKIRDENGKWKSIPSIKGEDGDTSAHAEQHAIGGSDELTPADIGAAEVNHTHTPDEICAAHQDHTHTPEEIGAAKANHNHDERYYTEAEVNQLLSMKAPNHTWGTEDIEAGSSSHWETGVLSLVIE